MKKIILGIDGMTCSACSNGLEKYLNKQNGIINASVNLVMSNASIDYDETILNQEKLEKYIKQAGFTSLGIFKEFKIQKQTKKEKIELEYASKLKAIDASISKQIETQAKAQGYDVVLSKGVVLYGGKDITSEIVKVVK